jgi:RNA polymerase sigma factor for flagellar operon FliA
MHAAEAKLWERYQEVGDVEARSELLTRHIGLVHHVARSIHSRVAGQVELDDLVGSGTVGLVRALESFELSRGLAFSTYAMPRIRGAILDDLRSADWIPRSVRSKDRDIRRATERLSLHLDRAPTGPEIAYELGIDLDMYWRWHQETTGGVLVPLDDPALTSGELGATLEETIAGSSGFEPQESLEWEGDVVCLREALAEIPERERTVLSLYYFEEMNLREIAAVLHLTESRISQIRRKAQWRLREALTPAPVAA